MATRTRVIDDPRVWDDAVIRLGGSFFHRYRWLSIMASSFGATFGPLSLVEDDRVVALLPELVKARGPLHTVNYLPLPYIGPLAPDEMLGEALAVVGERHSSSRTLRVLQELPRTAPDSVDLPGFERREERTVVVPLAGTDDELQARMEKRGRRAVAAAHRRGIEVGTATEQDVCELLPVWCAEAMARQGHGPSYPFSTYAEIWAAYRDDDDVRFSAARLGGRTVAVQVNCAGGRRALVWEGAASEEGRRLGATPALDWDALRWASARGADELDLVGAPTPGLTKYKVQFGGAVETFTVFERQSPLYRAVRTISG